LSVHPFEKMPLNELLMNAATKNPNSKNIKQLELFDL
jgi:hypothetical protein